jgi:hypothetical protein
VAVEVRNVGHSGGTDPWRKGCDAGRHYFRECLRHDRQRKGLSRCASIEVRS